MLILAKTGLHCAIKHVEAEVNFLAERQGYSHYLNADIMSLRLQGATQ